MNVQTKAVSYPEAVEHEITSFYNDYFEVLDDTRLAEWPDFFVDDCVYQIIPRENFESGHQLCTMMADSKGMLIDRVQGIQKTQMFAPRYCRRFYSGLRIRSSENEEFHVRQNLLVIQTLLDKPAQILLCGVSHDILTRSNNMLRFKERIVVADSEMIPTSLIYPV
jgi:3-phenylpropionate/cinnamic acid dioxygenase small subunit